MMTRYKFEESMGYLTAKINGMILKRNIEIFEKNGIHLTSQQFIALVYLWRQDGLTQQQLVELMFRDKAIITRLVVVLEKQNLVKRAAGQKDAREKHVFLTEKGKRLIHQATELVQDVLDSSYRGIEIEKLATCREVLGLIYKNLE